MTSNSLLSRYGARRGLPPLLHDRDGGGRNAPGLITPRLTLAAAILLAACGNDPKAMDASRREPRSTDSAALVAGDAPALPATVADSAMAAVVSRARRAVGWPARQVAAIALHARVSWAGPPYDVDLVSTPSGDIRLEFVGSTLLAITADSSVQSDGGGDVRPVGDTLATFVRGHDIVLTLLAPEARLRSLRVVGAARFAGNDAQQVTGLDALGGTMRLYYAAADGTPLGYEVEDHLRGGGTVTVALEQWTEAGAPRHPRHVRFTQGREVFRYAIQRFEVLDWAPASRILHVERGAAPR